MNTFDMYIAANAKIEFLEAKVAELQAEKDRAVHAFNMLQHDTIEANRIHNEQMNAQAAEIEMVRADLKREMANAVGYEQRVTAKMVEHVSFKYRQADKIAEQAGEIERRTKERGLLSRGLDIETAEIESLHGGD